LEAKEERFEGEKKEALPQLYQVNVAMGSEAPANCS
jgi:hypothetical protein